MSRHGGFRLFEKGDVFIFERTDTDTNTLIPLMFEDKPLQFADRKSAVRWLRMNGQKVQGLTGKKFAIVRFQDLIEISVEARVAVTILSRQREGSTSEPADGKAEKPVTAETEVKA
jgi:hypothetical protein